MLVPTVRSDEPFLRGDVNADGEIFLSDAIMLHRWLFHGGPLDCRNAGDVDDSGTVNLTDAIGIIAFVFHGHLAPAAPYPDVGDDPTPNASEFIDCESYDPVPAEVTEDVVELGGIDVRPGATVEIPVLVSNAVAIEAFQLVFRYDPAQFSPHPHSANDPDRVGLIFEGTFFEAFGDDRGSYQSLTPDPDAGVFTVGFIPTLVELGNHLPPGEATEVFRIRGSVSEAMEAGDALLLEPVEAYGPARLRAELTAVGGGSRYLTTIPRVFGFQGIVGDQIVFLRGDSNADRSIDLSDAVFTLGYLFLGGDAPSCLDAADSNDDGIVDVSDPIATLGFLFLEDGVEPPAPYPSLGLDPTSDGMNCEGFEL